MKLIYEEIICESRSDRFELFPFGDTHIGKRNCNELAMRKQGGEILRRAKMPNRHVRVVLGGDQVNSISPADASRFDFAELADWFVESDAEKTRERLSDMVLQEVKRAAGIFKPIKSYIIGAINGNHENMMRRRQHVNVHKALCEKLGITDLTDESFMKFVFVRGVERRVVKIYIRHGYGSGRSAGAEPNKLWAMLSEWEDADVCLTGHTHSFCIAPPKPVLYLPAGNLPKVMPTRYRFAGNWGCWLLSHLTGVGSYESGACYPAKPMMTLKVVVWPFWHTTRAGEDIAIPKIELREYPIL